LLFTLLQHRQKSPKAVKAEQERREHVEKESARRQWLADGGTAGDFDRE
jgi:hypothetical protein